MVEYQDMLQIFQSHGVDERNAPTIFHELQIHLDRCGTFWATILRKSNPAEFDESNANLRVAGVDPGVRTFNTVYDSKGTVTEMGPADIGKIYRLCAQSDKLQSRFSGPDVRSKRRCRMRKAWLWMHQRIRFLIRDCHRKCAKFLCENYDVVFLPTFDSKSMVAKSRGYRRISGKTARAMMTWSHYKFRNMLTAKAEESGTKIVAVTEEYTTRTCGACGHVRSRFTGKHFICPACSFECDRDVNGA
jgi:putative transposase